MEQFDKTGEQQVWQRVFARQEEVMENDLRGLLMGAMEQAAAYRYLAGVLTGKKAERAKRLYESQQAAVACLKGLVMLSGRPGAMPKGAGPSKEPAGKLLEKCYHRSRRAMAEYLSRSAEPEFGQVFRALADREGVRCVLIAEVLGM